LRPVERRDRLVPDQDRAPVVEGARDRDPLLLPAGQRACLGEWRLGQVDEAKDLGHRLHVVPGRPGERAQVVER
jgi:hypothetical protein